MEVDSLVVGVFSPGGVLGFLSQGAHQNPPEPREGGVKLTPPLLLFLNLSAIKLVH